MVMVLVAGPKRLALQAPFPAYTAHKLGFGGSQASVAIDFLATADWFRFSFLEM